MMIDGIGGAAGGIASSKATDQNEYRLPTDIQPSVSDHSYPVAHPLMLTISITL